MTELKATLSGVIHDRNFWYLVSALLTVLWVHFVAKDHPEYNDILAVLNSFVALMSFYVVGRGAAEEYRVRRASTRAMRLFALTNLTTRQPDPINCPWVSIETPDPKFATQWRVVDFKFEPGIGNTVEVHCRYPNGQPAKGQYIYQIWPTVEQPDDHAFAVTDDTGVCSFGIYNIQRDGIPGPHSFEVRLTKNDANAQFKDSWSELVRGIGNHENRHDKYTFTFEQQDTSAPIPPPEPPPTPPPLPPPGSGWVTVFQDDRAWLQEKR